MLTLANGKIVRLGRIAPPPGRLSLIRAASWARHGHRIMAAALSAIPDAFDCESLGIVPAVKDQGNCGSCHIFSACGVASSALIKAGQIKVADGFSEQWMLDCQRQLGGCDGGWEWDDCQVLLNGGPLDSAYGSYSADAKTCKSGMPMLKIADMGMCSSTDGIARTSDIQAMMMAHGPISVAVAADNAFANYTTGLFNGSGSKSINHAVILTGWRTVSGTVYWKLRNSWSKEWGDEGYMWIKAGANQVGDSAFWCSATPVPTPVPPGPTPPVPPVPPVPPGPTPTGSAIITLAGAIFGAAAGAYPVVSPGSVALSPATAQALFAELSSINGASWFWKWLNQWGLVNGTMITIPAWLVPIILSILKSLCAKPNLPPFMQLVCGLIPKMEAAMTRGEAFSFDWVQTDLAMMTTTPCKCQ